ncbi:hypothetical protein D7D25_02445 [Proteiniphilum sp. X52]|nr:hypothetical protein D7D25_02445 [Proteiniphilum sp. X52]
MIFFLKPHIRAKIPFSHKRRWEMTDRQVQNIFRIFVEYKMRLGQAQTSLACLPTFIIFVE